MREYRLSNRKIKLEISLEVSYRINNLFFIFFITYLWTLSINLKNQANNIDVLRRHLTDIIMFKSLMRVYANYDCSKKKILLTEENFYFYNSNCNSGTDDDI